MSTALVHRASWLAMDRANRRALGQPPLARYLAAFEALAKEFHRQGVLFMEAIRPALDAIVTMTANACAVVAAVLGPGKRLTPLGGKARKVRRRLRRAANL